MQKLIHVHDHTRPKHLFRKKLLSGKLYYIGSQSWGSLAIIFDDAIYQTGTFWYNNVVNFFVSFWKITKKACKRYLGAAYTCEIWFSLCSEKLAMAILPKKVFFLNQNLVPLFIQRSPTIFSTSVPDLCPLILLATPRPLLLLASLPDLHYRHLFPSPTSIIASKLCSVTRTRTPSPEVEFSRYKLRTAWLDPWKRQYNFFDKICYCTWAQKE
jgi:hypothetical protein